MSERVKKYLSVLKRIRRLGDRAKREYVRKCDKQFVECVSECAKNVIKGNVPLTSRQMKNLRHKRHDLRALSKRKNITAGEAQNSAERWIPYRSIASRVVGPR